MPNTRSPVQDAITQLNAIKGVNYKTMLKQLCRLANGVPEEVSNKNPNFINMVLLESNLAQAKNKTQFYPSRLSASLESIAPAMDALEKKRDARLQASDPQTFRQFNEDTASSIAERTKLLAEINHYIKVAREKLLELDKKLADRTPLTQKQILPNALKQIEKQITDFNTRVDKLNASEALLQDRIGSFGKRITHIARAAGVPVTPPRTPKLD